MAIVFCRPPCIPQTADPLPDNNPGPPTPPSGCCPVAIDEFDPQTTYAEGRLVVYNNQLFWATSANGPGAWDPSDWMNLTLDNTAGIQFVTTQDGLSIRFSGDGTAGDPLTAELIISDEPNNALQLDGDGRPFVPAQQQAMLSEGVTWWVDYVNGDDTNNGNIQAPFKTVQAAMAAASATDTILVYPGVYTIGTLTWKENVLVQGFGNNDSHQVDLRGHVVAGPTRTKIKDVILTGLTAGTPTFVSNATQGRHNLDNVAIRHNVANQTVVRFTGNNQNWVAFKDGSISGKIEMIDAAQVSTFQIILDGGEESPSIELDRPSVIMTITNKLMVGPIRHGSGSLIMNNITQVTKSSDGISLDSDAMQGLGALFLVNTSFLQVDGTWGEIAKGGTAPYTVFGVAYDPESPDLPGSPILGYQARDIHGNYDNPVNYNILEQDLRAHLIGIDEALAGLPVGKFGSVDYTVSLTGGWSSNETLVAYVLTEQTVFAVDFVDSEIVIESGSAINATLNIFKTTTAGVKTNIGSIAIVNSEGTFSGTGGTLDPGDVLTLESYANHSFSYVSIALRGYRQIQFQP